MRKILAILAFLAPAVAFGQYYGPAYNPANVAITGGTISNVSSITSTGNVNVQGNVSSTANTQPASITNSGVALVASPNVADAMFFDSTRTANNRTAEWNFYQGNFIAQFRNDAGGAVTPALTISGGQTGITGITSSSGTGTWTHTGAMTTSGVHTASGGLQLPVATVVTLPTCNTAAKGLMYAVSDATAPAYNGALTGGGAVIVPVFCSGTSWTAH